MSDFSVACWSVLYTLWNKSRLRVRGPVFPEVKFLADENGVHSFDTRCPRQHCSAPALSAPTIPGSVPFCTVFRTRVSESGRVREVTMAKTAVGLFENTNSGRRCRSRTRGERFSPERLASSRRAEGDGGSGVLSTPHTDFEVGLIRI